MKTRPNARTVKIIVITVIITVIVFAIIVPLGTWKGINIYIDRLISQITEVIEEQCVNDPLIYRGEVNFLDDLSERKKTGTLYDKDLATILWDIGGAVASSHCRESIPTPMPFKSYWIAYGTHRIQNKKKEMFGYIFLDPSTYTACIVFAGTYYEHQWRENLRLNMTETKELNGSSAETRIHLGFYESYLSVRPSLWKWWNLHGFKVRNLILTGRSLGGALSTICAYDFSLLEGVNILHYSFASPRVGNVSFAQEFNSRVPYSVRIYNTEDIVIDMPPAILGKNTYQHVGDPKCSKSFTLNTGSRIDNHISAYYNLPS